MSKAKRRTSRSDSELPRGMALLHDPILNKGTAFTEDERDVLGLRGLLPPRVLSEADQERRILENFRKQDTNLEKYIYLTSLQDRNERLFYRVVLDNIEEMMPIVYTPTVGEACKQFAHIFRRPRGLYVSRYDRGRIAEVIANWPRDRVGIVVCTDGERILGLGDLGADGMGIPVGKLSLYTLCAGVDPALCMPVMLDLGTNNEALLNDPMYIGMPERRLRGAEYDAFMDEFITALTAAYPDAVVQFEDFGRDNAFRLIEKYRDRVCCFDDDIQGTGSVTFSGLHSALRITGGDWPEQTLLFYGAGQAGVGIANTVVAALCEQGLSAEEARSRCWLMDSHGLVVEERENLESHKLPFAHEYKPVSDLLEAVEAIRPTALIGVSAQAASFTQPVIEAMARINERPIVFALSNPTSKSECTAEQAYTWSEGRAVFASGSPFPPVTLGETTHVPGQCNNAYIFPGVGLGLIASKASRVTDEMFLAAAKALSELTMPEDLERGSVFPPLQRIRDVSARIAAAVSAMAASSGLAREPNPPATEEAIRALMYEPDYESYV